MKVHNDNQAEKDRAAALARLGKPATAANGWLGPLYRKDDITFVGLLKHSCSNNDRVAELAIHAGPKDTANKVATPWEALHGEGVGVFMAYMPCDTGISEARYKLGATGRWFVVVARFPKDEYDKMAQAMRDNETSPSPDYTVDEHVLATLSRRDAYLGWAEITLDK